MDSSWEFAFGLAGAVGSVATAVAIYFLWKQSQQSQVQINMARQEMESTLRAWIGLDSFRVEKDRIYAKLKNHGSIPAKITKIYEVLSSTDITQEQLRSTRENYSNELMIFPNSEAEYLMELSLLPKHAYVGLLLIYEFSAKKYGKYGITGKYDRKKNEVIIREEFAH